MDLDGNSAATAANEDQGTGAIHGGQMRVSATDQTFGYLDGKLVAGSNITLTPGSVGAAETLTIASSGGGGGAPTDAEYIVASANGTLSAERVVTDTATVAKDTGTAGQLKLNIPDDAVSNGKLRNSGALSVIGRAANSTGDPADISASAGSDAVLLEFGSGLSWARIVDANVSASAAIAHSKLADLAGLSILGRSANSSGAMAAITGTDGQVVRVSGTTLGFGTIATAGIADDAVTPAKTSFYINTFTAVADPDFDLTGIPSDVLTGLDVYLRGTAASSAFFDILLNDTDTCDSMYHMLNDGGAFNAGSGSGPGVISATADNVIHIRIWTKTGLRRRCQVRSDGSYSGTARTYFLSGEWTDTAAAVTQLTLRLAGAVNWTAGTKAEVWGF